MPAVSRRPRRPISSSSGELPPPSLRVYRGLAVWCGGNRAAAGDLWLTHDIDSSLGRLRELFDGPLARHWRMFAWDLPGHGASPPEGPARVLTVAHAAWLHGELLRRFSGPRPVVLVGDGAGAAITGLVARLAEPAPLRLIALSGGGIAPVAHSGRSGDRGTDRCSLRSFAASLEGYPPDVKGAADLVAGDHGNDGTLGERLARKLADALARAQAAAGSGH